MKISRGNKIISGIIGIVLAMVIGLACFILSEPEQDMTAIMPVQSTPSRVAASPVLPVGYDDAETTPMKPEMPNASIEDRLVLELQRNYGKTISSISTQAALLDVKKYVSSLFPGEDGRAKFYMILKRAFPDLADQIMATIDKLEEYERWLADNEGFLASMTALERLNALWEKRHELFGEDAEEIWTGELLATEARTGAMQDIMSVLGESRDMTIEEKLDMYQDALRQTYENSADAHVLDQHFMLAKVFFSIDSVQEELTALSPEQRQFKINQVRREMGFSEEEIENMEVLDADRSRRWETGLKYMQEREAIASQFEGAQQEEQLQALRAKYFQDEAKTIELEEKEDFFRFKRPHIYGRN